ALARHAPVETLVIERAFMRRAGEVVIGREPKTLYVHWKKGERAALRYVAIHQRALAPLFCRRELHRYGQLIAGQEFERLELFIAKMVARKLEQHRNADAAFAQKPACEACSERGRIVIGVPAFVRMREDDFRRRDLCLARDLT